MALCDEQILAPIVVVVEKLNSPTRVQEGHAAYAAHVAVIGEAGISAVVIKGVFLVGKVGDDKIGQAVVIVVLKVHSHARVGLAVGVNCDLCSQAHLFKCAITFITIEKLKHRVIGYHNVDLAVAVVVCDRNTEPLAGLVETRFGRDFAETPVAVVMVDESGNRRKNVWVTVRAITLSVLSTPDVIEIPPQIA